jgi:hypothetical protein
MVAKSTILGLIAGLAVVLIAISVMGNTSSESLEKPREPPKKITTIVKELPIAESFDKDYILISYDEIPIITDHVAYADFHGDVDPVKVEFALKKVVQDWANANPEMKIALSKTNGDMHIDWRDTEEWFPLKDVNYVPIALGSDDCMRDWHQYSVDHLANTISHEFAHHLGIEHSPHESHLMYDPELKKLSERIEMSNIEIVGVPYSPLPPLPPFDDLGYNIPDKTIGGLWLISDDLVDQYNFYENEGNSSGMNQIREQFNCLNRK